jgi:2-deoxystreptamine N-acetyl-D-glucosaminyltransferase/2-deoxystreptamine glucosyltransferase
MGERAVRVLVLTADYPPDTWSGIGAAVATQVGALADRPDVAVRVLVAFPDGRAATGHRDGVVTPLSWRRCPVRPGEFDVLHLNSLALAELAVRMRRRLGLPLVYTAHSLLHRELAGVPDAAPAVRVQAALLRASDAVVVLSRAEQAAALARHPDLAGRCTVLPNGVPPAAGPPRPAPDGPVVFAGRFTWTKGIDLVAAAAAGSPGRDIVLAGGRPDAPGAAVVAEVAARHPRRCRVLDRLPHPAVEGLLRQAAMVVVPSRYEPFGMVALEAMRVGTPVLAAAVGGLPEVVPPGSGGRLVRSATPAAWRAATGDLLDSPGLRAELARRGPGHAARHHDPAALAGRLLDEVYRPLVDPAARPAEVARGR